MNPIRKYIKGFILTGVLIFALSWLGWGIFWLIDMNKSRWVVTLHMSPHHAYPAAISGDDWCVLAATEEFLSRSVPDKMMIAERFYEKNIQGLDDELFYDREELKGWFARTARMTVEEAPIQDYQDSYSKRTYRYRQFPDLPHYKVWKAFMNYPTFFMSLVTALLNMVTIIVIFAVVKRMSGGLKPAIKEE